MLPLSTPNWSPSFFAGVGRWSVVAEVDFESVALVRLLINDTNGDVFADPEIGAFLHLEGGSVKRAAAQALDTIADDEALTSKVIRTQDLTTDGAKVADSLRKRAAALRDQADAEDDDAGFYFGVVDIVEGGSSGPELVDRWSWS